MAKYDTETKPALNALFRTSHDDLVALKAAIDKAAEAGATPREIAENVGGTAKWNQIVRRLKKAKLV
jgi:hypothetical protein